MSLTNRVTHLCECNGVADLRRTRPPNMCYHAQFGRFALKGVGINAGEPQNWGALELRFLGMGRVADPKIYTPPPARGQKTTMMGLPSEKELSLTISSASSAVWIQYTNVTDRQTDGRTDGYNE